MSSKIDWQLMVRYFSNAMTSADEERFDLWLKSDFENQALLNFLETVWNTPEKKHDEADLKSAWENLAKKAGISSPLEKTPGKVLPFRRPVFEQIRLHGRTPLKRILRYAAVVVAVVSMHYLYQVMKTPSHVDTKNELQEVFVEYGKTASLTLPDGTKITLDAGTSLSYPIDFTNDTREVHLRGEGYFEVAPNLQKPFIINANDAVIKVIGTKFNVSAWTKNQAVKVAVAEGRVSLRSSNQAEIDAVVIKMGELSALRDQEILTKPVRVDIEKYLAWLNRDLVFDNTPLFEVLDQLERWYKLQFELPDPVYYSVRISGAIKKKPVNDIIEALSMMINLESRREGNRVYFVEKPNKNSH